MDGHWDRRRLAAQITLSKNAGVTHVTALTTCISGHHKRIDGHSTADHLAAVSGYRKASPTCCSAPR
jgi:hypothetical protein